ncbi:MAG: type IV secretion system DNA-binding domain-containing protein [bacterium]|nr:type IV secretion system DNA-binding domain-containing protein [bacterium]
MDVISNLIATNILFATFWWTILICLVIVLVVMIIRAILVRQHIAHNALHKKVFQLRVSKEGSKGEEEDKGGKGEYQEVVAVAESLYLGLGGMRSRDIFKAFFLGREDEITFEIVAIDGLIKFFAIVPDYLQSFFEQQLLAQYPSAQIEETPDYNIFLPHGSVAAATLQLNRHWVFPLRTYRKMDSDPLNALTNALSKAGQGQGIILQMTIRTAPRGWRTKGQAFAREMQKGKSVKEAMQAAHVGSIGDIAWGALNTAGGTTVDILRSTGKNTAHPSPEYRMSPLEQELVKVVEEKGSKAGFQVNIRIIGSAQTQELADMQVYNVVNSFAQYTGPESNIALVKNKRIPKSAMVEHSIYRHFDARHCFILNAEELASIFHLPLSTTETPNIDWLKSRSAPPPVNMPQEGVLLGENVYRGTATPVHMLRDDRRRHTYVIGMTGSGKTTLMENMIIQDIKNGEGCCFIDPHGEAVDHILSLVPPERADDVILFDPADYQRPKGLNLLEFDPKYPEQKTFVINEFVMILDKLYDLRATGGPMFEQYLRNALLLIMEDPESGSTLMEVSKVLADEEFRSYKLSKCKNSVVSDFWVKEAQKAGGEAALANMVPYITSKLNQFVSNDIMRPIIGQQTSAFNVREVMDQKKILLVKLSKGQLGDLNAYLLGLIMVGKITMAALSRGDIADPEQRQDFFLYIDEFQNFITDSIAIILSEARKYRLCLTIGHQYIAQLTPKTGDTKVRDAVFGNVGTIVNFRVGVDDAELIAKQMAPVFNEFDVINIERTHAYVRLLINGTAARPFNMRTFAPTAGDDEIANAIGQLSQLKYGRDRELVEREILRRAKHETPDDEDEDEDDQSGEEE